MSDARPLDARQRRAASLLAQGWQQKRVAGEIGVSAKSVRRWAKRDDFAGLVRHHREAAVPEAPTAEAVLLAALGATRRDGSPDWQHRIAAARALMTAPTASPEAKAEARATTIYVESLGGDDADPR